jgi:hypothetical protein
VEARKKSEKGLPGFGEEGRREVLGKWFAERGCRGSGPINVQWFTSQAVDVGKFFCNPLQLHMGHRRATGARVRVPTASSRRTRTYGWQDRRSHSRIIEVSRARGALPESVATPIPATSPWQLGPRPASLSTTTARLLFLLSPGSKGTSKLHAVASFQVCLHVASTGATTDR